MKKIFVTLLLVMFVICGIFAKDKKTDNQEQIVEVTSSEFFTRNYPIQKDVVYKITNVKLEVGFKDRVYISCDILLPDSLASSLGKILSTEEKAKIKRAEQYAKFKTNYIVYAQAKKSNPTLIDLKIIKIENIPTESDIDAEEKRLKDEAERLEAERIAKEQAEEAARIAEEKEKQAKFEKQKEELSALFAKSGKEGFDNMPWGTDIDFFLWLKPEAKEIESEGSITKYELKLERNIKVYNFYEGKLVSGVTVYSNVSSQTGIDIDVRLNELYGKPSDKKDLTEHKSESFSSWDGIPYSFSYTDYHMVEIWNKSPTFKIQLDITGRELDDGFGVDFMTKAMLNQPLQFTITYSNEKKMSAIKASDEKKKKAAEAEAQRQRMDNLGL